MADDCAAKRRRIACACCVQVLCKCVCVCVCQCVCVYKCVWGVVKQHLTSDIRVEGVTGATSSVDRSSGRKSSFFGGVSRAK